MHVCRQLELFCERERSGSSQAKSRAAARELPSWHVPCDRRSAHSPRQATLSQLGAVSTVSKFDGHRSVHAIEYPRIGHRPPAPIEGNQRLPQPVRSPFAFPSWALNSAVECHLHTVEVIGSNPIAPTSNFLQMRGFQHCACPQMSNCTLPAFRVQGRTIRTTPAWAARFCSLTAWV